MIDITALAIQAGLPGLGCFVGTYAALYVYCPNHGCCQQKRVSELLEDSPRGVTLEQLIRSEK